jgi:hypothetical protein
MIYILPILLLLTGCGNAFRVYHDMDPSAAFDQYETYSFLDWTEGNKKTITGMELERIRAQFARELEKKGLSYQEEGADVKVKITVYFREARQPVYGYYYGYYPGRYNYIERALSVDLFESTSKKHIWHSAAVGAVGATPEQRAEELPGQVAEMLKAFPAGKAI